MKLTATTPKPPPRPESRDAAPNTQTDQAERPGRPRVQDFRATALHIATQLDIEAAMWQIMGKPPQ